jgi:hypothetical protein
MLHIIAAAATLFLLYLSQLTAPGEHGCFSNPTTFLRDR